MWYLIPNYAMKCRLYLNEAQKQKVDTILTGLRIAHNVTMYEMVTNMVNTKESIDKAAAENGETKIVHFPDWAAMMKKEWLDHLRQEHPIIREIPSGALSSNVCGIFVDCKKAWEAGRVYTRREGEKKVKYHIKGRCPVEKYSPQYYGQKKPRTSYSYQEQMKKFEVRENRNVIYCNLANVSTGRLRDIKIRGWNQKLRFGEKQEADFAAYLQANREKPLIITISRDNCGDYYIVFKLNNVYKWMPDEERKAIGVDAGIADVAITSEGKKYPCKRFAREKKRRKKLLGRQCSRRWGWANEAFRKAHRADPTIVPSKNYQEAMQAIQRLDRKVARRREDYNHSVTYDIVRSASFIGIEDLNVKGMMANRHIAYAAGDAAMSDLLTKLAYKSGWYGTTLIQIGRFEPSSQRCNHCGHLNPATKNLSVRQWVCPQCGTRHDRDINAARNIRDLALEKQYA